MADGMSKANARQGAANLGRNNRYKGENRAEVNKVKGIVRHMKRVTGGAAYVRLNVESSKFKSSNSPGLVDTEIKAINRLADKIGIARVRQAIESTGVKLS